MIFVDLNTRVLPRNHEIFFARPGSRYRFYPEFVQDEVIFLDLPGLGLTRGVSLREQGHLNARIHRSRSIKSWYNSKLEDGFPSNDLNDYVGRGGDIGVSQLRSALYGYFERAKRGDLVLVAPSAYSQNAFIGEFTERPEDIIKVRAHRFYQDTPLDGRAVKWLAQIEKRFLERDVLDIIAKPNIFVTLPKSVRKKLYDLAYGGYTFEGDYSVRFDVTEEEFTSRDDLTIQSFFNFVAVNTRALSEDGDGQTKGFREAAFIDAGEFSPDLRAEVSSPGFLNLFSSKITPLVAAALFAIAVDLGIDALKAVEDGTLRVGNSQAAADDACVADVERQAITQIKLSGAIDWPEACDRARQVAARTGIKGPAKIKK